MRYKADPEVILEVASTNAECIQTILNEIFGLIPDKNQERADELLQDLEYRMFYQDYLYDAHGSLGDAQPTDILDYSECKQHLKILHLCV